MPIEVRPVAPGEIEAMLLADQRGFGIGPPAAGASRSWAKGELDRAFVAVDGDELVGMSRNYTFELTMPGGATVPVAAVSWVSVIPTHRRRGVLTAMLAALDADARGRGEVASILTASESHIYGRFGYGIANWRLGIHAERVRVSFVDADGADGAGPPRWVRLVERPHAESILPELYDRARRLRAGMVSRPDFWWEQGFWEQFGGGDKAFFVAVTGQGDDADGYVAYDITGDWVGGLVDRRLLVWDLQSTNSDAHAALWRYVFGVDLVGTVAATNLAVDDPLRFLVHDLRRVRVDYVNDGLWLRPIDVAALLAARRYGACGRLVVEVRHAHGAPERFVLDAGEDGATCAPSDASPDLVCSDASLGALVLGGNRWSAYARAGRVDEVVPGAAARADAMFATDPAPATISYF